MQKPMIYLACDFRRHANGYYKVDYHYIAATSSAQAEASLREEHSEALTEGLWFIQTDEFKSRHPRNIAFSLEHGRTPDMSEQGFTEWKSMMTVARRVHQDIEPAAFRLLSEQKEGVGSGAISPAMLEAVASANSHLNNAGLPDLEDMLKAVSNGAPYHFSSDPRDERQGGFIKGWNLAMDMVLKSMGKVPHALLILRTRPNQ